eukprot:scaffold24788_cov71-Phaeocystis_antarctica.AAC.1
MRQVPFWARRKNSSGSWILARRNAVLGVVLPALYDDAASHTRLSRVPRCYSCRRVTVTVGIYYIFAYAGATALVGLAAAPPVLAEANSRPRQTRRTHAEHAQTAGFCFFLSLFGFLGAAA